jgi:hypothetical protein
VVQISVPGLLRKSDLSVRFPTLHSNWPLRIQLGSPLRVVIRVGLDGPRRLPIYHHRKRTPSRTVGMSQKCKDGRRFSTFQNGNANCAGRSLAAGGGIGSKISGGEAIEAFLLSQKGRARLLSRAIFIQPVRGSNSRRKAAGLLRYKLPRAAGLDRNSASPAH